MNRRRLLALAAGSLSSGLLAGCLADGTEYADDDREPNSPSEPGSDGLPEGLERVDEPPHEIDPDARACDREDDAEQDPLYLCASMASEPSLSFEQVATSSRVLTDAGLGVDDEGGDAQLFAALLTAEDDLERVEADADEGVAGLLADVDFDAEAVLLVQTGWGSGSVRPHLKRIEEREDGGVHAHGCYRRPCIGTTDYTLRTALARFGRPEALEPALVSLTIDEEMRITVAAGEGVVTLENER